MSCDNFFKNCLYCHVILVPKFMFVSVIPRGGERARVNFKMMYYSFIRGQMGKLYTIIEYLILIAMCGAYNTCITHILIC